MKKLFLLAAVAAALTASAGVKIGTVDMLKLVRNHPNYESNRTLVAETEKDYSRKLDKMRSELEALSEEGKKMQEQLQNPMLSAAAKQKSEKDLTVLQNKFLSAQQQLRSEMMRSQQDLQDLEARLLKGTSSDLKKRITEFAEKAGYDFVLDASAAPYAKASYDVTPAILKTMGVDPAKAVDPAAASEKKHESK